MIAKWDYETVLELFMLRLCRGSLSVWWRFVVRAGAKFNIPLRKYNKRVQCYLLVPGGEQQALI